VRCPSRYHSIFPLGRLYFLQLDTNSRMLYGSVDEGVTVAAEASVHKMMQAVGERLFIAERTFTPKSHVAGSSSAGEAPAASPPSSDAAGAEAQAASPASSSLLSWTVKSDPVASSKPARLVGPVEMKAIRGSDGRVYALDIVRATPRDPAFYDDLATELKEERAARAAAGSEQPGHGQGGGAVEAENPFHTPMSALLRPELLAHFDGWRRRQALREHKVALSALAPGAEQSSMPPPPTIPPLRLNVNVFTKFASQMDPDERDEDEAAVRQVSSFLLDHVIPQAFDALRNSPGFAVDGEQLTRSLHALGINVRYMGRLATMAQAQDPHVSVERESV
jgi:hypothetical protein